VLRDPGRGDAAAAPEAPQPRLEDLTRLVENARATGQLVELVDVRSPGEVPEGIGRAAYRVVQEGVTNAVKHAPGSQITVRVSGAPGSDLVVRVSDSGATRVGTTDVPGSGFGLVGLAERVSLAGGRLSHGAASRAGYWVEAALPWPA
jgi:signal transduction histidine kinase